ncbi:dUTP diphosphatase [Gallicola sp. Sow4_E12]|uniref:dUTP diphosphatase n=1 Tax=Gallicola sp. Sow4_E12 TaxID=3438785 RepID=UPI003F8ED59E
MIINIINKSTNPLPEYATEGSAGVDIRADLQEDIILDSLDRFLIPTGIFVEIPEGYEIQIRARSGLSIKKGLTLVNAVGTIDSDYRGEIMVPIINLSKEKAVISHGERVAQMILAKYERIEFKEAEELKDTQRGDGGFGHTGL